MKNKRQAVFAGDIFWSSCPYESLDVFLYLSNFNKTDIILFENDIRLNKTFTGNEKFYFDVEKFKTVETIKTIKTWKDFFNISKDYDNIFCSSKYYPKTRPVKIPKDILNQFFNIVTKQMKEKQTS